MSLRPEEQAARDRMERDKDVRGSVKKAGSLALALGAGGLASKLSPFLSEFIPMDLAMKGINKVAPKVGEFLKKGQDMGLNVQEGFNFVKEKFNPKQTGNIIEQYSPELFQFLQEGIKKGASPYKTAAKAYEDQKFKGIIDKMTQDHKTSFAEILDTIFGTEVVDQNVRQESLGKFNQKKKGLMEEERERFQQAYPQAGQQAQQPQQGGSAGDQAIIAALQKILSM